MNQEKIGEALRVLRKQKGLTQEQLAEKFNTTNRSISRWETGNNLPDISVLIDLAEFYDVELKDILSGEVGKANMEEVVKDTVLLVADYTNAAKERTRVVMHFLFLLSAICLFISFVLDELEINSPVFMFVQGLGIGLSFGSLIIGAIMTSKNAEKFYQFKQKKMDTKITVSNKVLLIFALMLYVSVVVGLFLKFDKTIIIVDLLIATILLIAIYKNKNS